MPVWVQVVLLALCLAVGVVISLTVRRKCQRWGYDRRQTNVTVTTTATACLFFLLYAMPDCFPALGVPTDLGLTLIGLDVLVFVIAAVMTIWLDRRKDIATFIDHLTPPES